MTVDQLIARQISFWEAMQRLEREEPRTGRGRVGPVSFGPYLLISRERGSGGHTLARQVGARLGWRVFEREIVDEIARSMKVRTRLIESLDERDRSVLEETITPLIVPDDVGAARYARHLKQVVLTLGRQGSVVIVGRGAGYFLPGDCGLRVSIVGNLEHRVRRLAAEEGLTLEVARARVHQDDRDRESFVRHHFGRTAGHPLDHDVVINTSTLSLSAAVELILSALQQKLGVTARPALGGGTVQPMALSYVTNN